MGYLIPPSSPLGNYTVENCTAEDIMVADSGYVSTKVHLIQATGEFDVTGIRNILKEYKLKHGNAPSLMAVYMYCYAQILHENKRLHALKSWRNKLYVFDDADLFFPYEIDVNGKKIMAKKIIRAVNKKSVFEIETILQQIRQHKKVETPTYQKLFLQLPKWIRKIGYSIIMGLPIRRKDTFGNVYFGAVAKRPSSISCTYGFPYHFHSCGLFISEPYINKEKNTLHIGITASVDHAIANGLALNNFGSRFQHYLLHFKLP